MPDLSTVSRVSKQGAILLLMLGLALSATLEITNRRDNGVGVNLNHLLNDSYNRLLAKSHISDQIAIIDIDDQSLEGVGQWPWPRYTTAALIQAIADMRPRAIGMDIMMPEPDRTSLDNIQIAFQRNFGLDIAFTGVPSTLTDNDGYLAQVLKKSGTVTAHYYYFDHSTESQNCQHRTFDLSETQNILSLPDAPGLLCNTTKLRTANQRSGFVNIAQDSDGILRSLSLFIRHNDKVYPNLVLATLLKALDVNSAEVKKDIFGMVVEVAGHRIPVKPDGSMLLNYPKDSSRYPHFSALNILSGNLSQEALEGKIVLIGTSAVGLNDYHQTVYDTSFPGIETLAVSAGNILEDSYSRYADWHATLSLILSLITATTMAMLFALVNRPLIATTATLGWMSVIFICGGIIYSLYGVYLSLAVPLLVAAILYTIFSFIRYSMERQTSFAWYRKLARSQQVTLESLATVMETRDYETGGHIKRTQHIVRIIAEQLAASGLHSDILTPAYIQLLYVSAPLHDIGKVGVPDHILLKPGPLTTEEFAEMKKHTEYGNHILLSSGRRLGGDNFLELAREIAQSHHEQWNGSGYPRGVSGQDIALSGRIMAIADVYDALTSKRCYKRAYSHDEAKAIMMPGRGSMFDPDVFDAFMAREDEIREISEANHAEALL